MAAAPAPGTAPGPGGAALAGGSDLGGGVLAEIEASLSAVDEQQRAMMEERVIVTDYYDNPLGSGSKKESA